jgi:hypothetical protein
MEHAAKREESTEREVKPGKCRTLAERACQGFFQMAILLWWAIAAWPNEKAANLNQNASVAIDCGAKQIALLP